jgi:hypothetical protein
MGRDEKRRLSRTKSKFGLANTTAPKPNRETSGRLQGRVGDSRAASGGPSLWRGRLTEVRIKQGLSLQEGACQRKESVGDTADRTSMRVATSSQGGVARAALGVVLGCDTGPMIDRVAQPYLCSVAHDDDVRLAASFGDRRDTGQRAQRLIVTAAERPRGLGEQWSEN